MVSVNTKYMSSRELKTSKFSTHSMKYICYSPQKSKYPPCSKFGNSLVEYTVFVISFRYRKVAIRENSYIFAKFSKNRTGSNNFDCTVITTYDFKFNT